MANELTKALEKFSMAEGSTINEKIEFLDKKFNELAKFLFNGYFEISNGKDIRKVYPTTIEFYYHEEEDKINSVKDYIMYLKGINPDKKREKKIYESYPICTINPHVSGIDVTFEDQENTTQPRYRASALIREFRVEGSMLDTFLQNEERSTKMYDVLLSGFSLSNNGFSISWKEDLNLQKEIRTLNRHNVAIINKESKKIKDTQDTQDLDTYTQDFSNNKKIKIERDWYLQDKRKWRFTINDQTIEDKAMSALNENE